MYGKSDLHEVLVVLHAETQKAWLLSVDGLRTSAAWVPKSQGELDIDSTQSVLTLTAPAWLLEEKGFV